MISVVLPSYRNPKYLDLCLHSLLTEQKNSNEVIVIIDGYVDESQWVIDKYKDKVGFLEFEQNRGLQSALNCGVWNATNDKILIINEDNVFSSGWDEILEKEFREDVVVTINQVEPEGPSMYGFPINDLGKTEDTFQYDKFQEWEEGIRRDENTPDGEIFPFMISKRNYMMVGGFDTFYGSPFICDWDFFLKLEISGVKFERTHKLHFYHFGGKSTKHRDDEKEVSDNFHRGEAVAYQMFEYKWGFKPQNGLNNSKKPSGIIKGVNYK
tara:strand:- start:59 stop:862 length:804 start_codon:yes stop_codon:yes gene_type:complete